MEHSKSAVGGTAVGGLSTSPRQPFGWLPVAWKTLVGILVVGLLGLAAFFVLYKPVPPTAVATAAPQQEAKPPRPAYTEAEEAYMKALWPIHGEVEVSSARMSLGQIFYITRDFGQAELKGRVDEAMASFRRAERSLRALQPPPSFQKKHQEYLAAVRLFQDSTTEVLKVFKDGNEEHLRTAYPTFQQATDKIRDVGADFWPEEFPAH